MQGVALLVALSALGVDHTWRQTEDGQVEYVLQIEPVFLSALAEGKEITSELPADVERVDRLCIRIGSGSLRTLPKIAPPWPELNEAAEQHATAKSPPETPLAVYQKANGDLYASHDLTHGWQPASESETTYLIQLDPELLKLLEEGDEVYAAILPDAGVVSGFTITSGRNRVPRQTARPPVMTVAQLQAQGSRTSSPAADVPPTSDFTGGAGNSIYGPVETTDLGTGAADMLQPPVNRAEEVPRFDSSQFGKRTSSTTGSVRPGTSRPAPRSAASSFPAPRQATQQPAENVLYDPEEEPAPRVASRTTGSSNLGQNDLPQRRTNVSDGSLADEKRPEFPGWFSFILFCAFCASLGGNVYLIWTAAEFHHRYKLAVERLRSAGRS
ncbi:MAG TPA: hypothetical protein VMP01_04950 [Pirellulaceae bacterium]|nr:hypothetical protein [Pirellulaceae bacterium]